jgi:hypothetical protein
MSNESVQTKDLDREWDCFMPRFCGCIPYPIWQYLQGQNVEALEDRKEQFLNDVRLASSLEEEIVRIAFALRDCDGNIANILSLELEGLLRPCNVRKRYELILKDAPIVGASVHFGEPNKRFGIAVSVESAMSLVIATNGMRCWACLGSTGLRTLQMPETVREVCVVMPRPRALWKKLPQLWRTDCGQQGVPLLWQYRRARLLSFSESSVGMTLG